MIKCGVSTEAYREPCCDALSVATDEWKCQAQVSSRVSLKRRTVRSLSLALPVNRRNANGIAEQFQANYPNVKKTIRVYAVIVLSTVGFKQQMAGSHKAPRSHKCTERFAVLSQLADSRGLRLLGLSERVG